jgi:A/G-specific adenine glycosylase
LARLFNFHRSIDYAAGRKALWQNAAALVPTSNSRIYNSALVDLGAIVCLPRKPKCGICPVKRFCRAKNPEALPIKKPKPGTKRLIEKHALVVGQGKILLEQSRRRWRGMWILPPLQRRPPNQRPIYKSIFPFTHHRVALNVFGQRQQKVDQHSQRWIRINSLQSIPIPSPHRKALRHLLSELAIAPPRRQRSSGS